MVLLNARENPEPAAGWVLSAESSDTEQQRVHDAWFALAGGGIGTSGHSLLTWSSARRGVIVAGVYDGDGPATQLLEGPALSGLDVDQSDNRLRRSLDMGAGVVYEQVHTGAGPIDMVRFVSSNRPGIVAVRTTFPGAVTRGAARFEPPGAEPFDAGSSPVGPWTRVAGTNGGIAVAVNERRVAPIVDDIGAIKGNPESLPAASEVEHSLACALDAGFDQLLDEHRAAWNARWADADVEIVGDDQLQLETRFALFQLIANVGDSGEAAVGARGVSGNGYRGHVFWDADTFVLPFLAATHPAAARAMLEYRIRRLPAARELARERQCAGARFPWESARTGRDVTPSTIDRAGKPVVVRTGELEEHIVADVAWAANEYLAWTGDEAFGAGPGLELLVETARYWASRVRIEGDGSAHIYGVIGPDEYHEPVDDNAFTNVMARWNLRTSAAALERTPAETGVDRAEVAAWRDVADALVDGFDPVTRVYEQFAGFNRLEPLLVADYALQRPVAADLLLGAARVSGAQVVKQADVLMLHHLVPHEVVPGSLEPNLRYYDPRTAHGSSLSPAIHAALFARANDLPRALDALRLASGIDLDDLTGTTSEGLHLATMGGLWQALVMGFGGMRARDGRLCIDPRIPPAWNSLTVRVRFRDTRVRVEMEPDGFTVQSNGRVALEVGSRPVTLTANDAQHFRRSGQGWELTS